MPGLVNAVPCGVLVVDKPAGVTSRRAVDLVGVAAGTRGLGHAGTLDPLARGVVLVCLGSATRLADVLHELPKWYQASFRLGCASPSDDLETPLAAEPDPVRPERAAVVAALAGFRGEILQRPCDYSAAHVAGRRAYRLARAGRSVRLESKRVRIDRLELTGYDWPRLDLDVVCSAGTFIRALGRDLALALGTRAVMTHLVRTAIGPFDLGRATPLEEVEPATVADRLVRPLDALPHLPRAALVGERLARAVRGAILTAGEIGLVEDDPARASLVAAHDDDGDLVGLLRLHPSGGYRLRPNFRPVGATPSGPNGPSDRG